MVSSQAQRADEAVTRMLASLSGRSAADLRRDLELSEATGAKLAAFQARAAAALAALERHGDGGAGVLRHPTGVSRRQTEGQARTARILGDMPAVREALEQGSVSFANAARLAQAAEGTRFSAVENDAELIARAPQQGPPQPMGRAAPRRAFRAGAPCPDPVGPSPRSLAVTLARTRMTGCRYPAGRARLAGSESGRRGGSGLNLLEA